MGFIKWMDASPKWLKILLVLFVGIFWGIYRILRSLKAKNILGVILAIITFWIPIIWILDIITIILSNKVLWFD